MDEKRVWEKEDGIEVEDHSLCIVDNFDISIILVEFLINAFHRPFVVLCLLRLCTDRSVHKAFEEIERLKEPRF